MKYYIGIDGGGTKTAICAASIDEPSLRYIKITGSDWRQRGVQNVAKDLKESIGKLMGENYGLIAGIAMGIPCYGESERGDDALERIMQETFAGISLYITNDVEVGWAGSRALSTGINVVAGTGSIAFGKDSHGNTARSGGWGEFIGDEGSCYWMGRKVTELFSKQADGRIPKDELYTTVYRELGLKNDIGFIDCIHEEYLVSRDRVAILQLLAEKAALAGSQSAKALYESAAVELGMLVDAICAQLDFSGKPWEVSYTGGLFKAGELILPQFSRAIEKKGGKLVPPRFSPTEGAVLLAFQNFYPEALPKIQSILQNPQNKLSF